MGFAIDNFTLIMNILNFPSPLFVTEPKFLDVFLLPVLLNKSCRYLVHENQSFCENQLHSHTRDHTMHGINIHAFL